MIQKGVPMFHEPTLNNPHYNDCYFSYDDGLAEALYVFVDGNRVVERAAELNEIVIGETGFGTGLNLIATIRALRDNDISDTTIEFLTVERYTLSPERIDELVERFGDQLEPEYSAFRESWKSAYESLQDGWNEFSFTVDGITAKVSLFNGDVIPFLESIPASPDAWFLDGHSPDKNPDMWNETVLGLIGEKSKIDSTVATFTAAGIVKEGLRKGGYFIKRKKGFGGKRHMITGMIEEPVE